MEWFFRDYGRYLNKANDTLTTRNYVMEFDMWTNTKELEENIKIQGYPSDL